MVGALRASSLPARADAEGGGDGGGFLRRRLPAPHGPFRRLPLMRSAAGPRAGPAARLREGPGEAPGGREGSC